jgi:amino acid adenylation domain-containing protein
LTQALTAFSRQEGATLYMTLLAAFNTLLYRYTAQEDLIVGSPTANRNRRQIQGLLGCFINTLALRTNLSGNPTFRDLLGRVRKVATQSYAYQDMPFEKLVEELQPKRDMSHAPVFQVMFMLHNTPQPTLELSGLTATFLEVERGTSKFDLTLELRETEDGLSGCFEYSTDLFDAATIARMAGHFQTLLEGIVANPMQRISDLPLLTAAEQHQLLVEWNDTFIEYPQDACLHSLIETQAKETPDAVAVVFEDEQLTYRQLNAKANQLAYHLRSLGVGPDVLVGLCVERSLEMVVGLLGVLKAGGAYVPLDPAYPKDRVAFMVQDAQMPVLLTQQRLVESLPEHQAHVLCLDTDWEVIAQLNEENLPSQATPDNLAYVIYTSGSTGKPKGVQICHRAVVNFLISMRLAPGLTARDVLLSVTTLSFDIAALELFLPMIVGARVVMVSREVASDGKQLSQILRESGATVMQATPASWRLLLEAGWQGNKQLKILCGGEPMTRDLANQLQARTASLWNMYGPTETTIWSSVYEVESGKGAIPIGRPIANTQIYLLDQHLQPVPIGVPGELHIGGDGLSRGYLNRPELNSEKFIPNPFSNQPGDRLYKTGDLARYLPDGNIECLGRIDFQVKIRGFRMELGEIESVLRQHPAVRESVVVAREDVPGDKRLVAYLLTNLAVDRVPLQTDCLVEWDGSEASIALTTVDLSSSGICLVNVPATWKIGQLLGIRLQLPGVQDELKLKGTLAWQQHKHGGVLFQTTPTEQALLRQSIKHISKTEGLVVSDLRRAEPRLPLESACLVEFESGQTMELTTHNIGLGGIRLVANAADIWQEGQRLRLRLQLPAFPDELWLKGTVVWHVGEYAGILFETTLTERTQLQQRLDYLIEVQGRSLSHLRSFLKDKLPNYMVPSAFVMLDTLPLTPNGKVDRRALPAPEQSLDSEKAYSSGTSSEYVAPQDDLEFQLTKIWEKILGIQPISLKDNFFDLGGHSLLAVRLFSQIRESFSKDLPLTTLFHSPTIEQLANLLRSQGCDAPTSSLVPLQPNGDKPPLFCIYGILLYHDLARNLGSDQPVYGVYLQEEVDLLTADTPEQQRIALTTVQEWASRYLREIRKLQPVGPYYLAGESFGGIVAYEMAQQLHKEGEKVALLALFDPGTAGCDKKLPWGKRIVFHLQHLLEEGFTYALKKLSRRISSSNNRLVGMLRKIFETFAAFYGRSLSSYLAEVPTQDIRHEYREQAMRNYVPLPYPGKVSLFQAMDQSKFEAYYSNPEAWRELATGGLEVHPVPGDHLGILQEPNVQVLASNLKTCLEQEQANDLGIDPS